MASQLKWKYNFQTLKNLLEKRQENLNYRRPLFLRHSISLHNIRLCCLSLKLSLATIYLFYKAINKHLLFFRKNTISVTYKRNKDLRENFSPSLFPRTTKQSKCSIERCNRKCDICKSLLVVSPDFTCFVTKRKYKIKGFWSVKVEVLFIWYPENSVVKNILGLPLAWKNDR